MKSPLFTGIEKIYFKETNSTNLIAKDLFIKGLIREGSVVFTDYQSAGKGQNNSIWQSEKEMNILMSLLYQPVFLPTNKYYYLNMAVCIGLCEALINESGFENIKIKWPNDIIIPDKGKLAGILIENSISNRKFINSVIGMGINVNQLKFNSGYGNSISMRQLTGRLYDRNYLMDKICEHIEKYYLMLRASKFSQLHDKYLSLLFAHKEIRRYKQVSTGKTIMAQIIDVDHQGKLIMEDKKGNKLIFGFKEII